MKARRKAPSRRRVARCRSPFGLIVCADAGCALFKLCSGPAAWMPGASGGVAPSANTARAAPMIEVEAKPFAFALDPEHVALVVIDMQRDFLEARRLRRDARQRPRAGEGDRADGRGAAGAVPRQGLADPSHAREPRAGSLGLPAGQAAARQAEPAHRRSRADGAHPHPRRAGRRHRAGAGARCRARSSSTSPARACFTPPTSASG